MPSLARLIRQAWRSPTWTTWASFLAKTVNVAVVLVFVLRLFRKEEVALWQLFLTVINLQFMIDMGFTITFARVIAYAMGGADDLGDFRQNSSRGNGQPNWVKVEQIVATMHVAYRRLAYAMMALSLLLLTPGLIRPIAAVEDQFKAWIAWGVIVLTSAYCFYGRVYESYLQGVDEIPRWRRGEAFTGVAAAISGVAILLLGGGILELAIARQACYVWNVLHNRHLCRIVHEGRWQAFRRGALEPEVFRQVWSRTWRTGLGLLLSLGLIHLTGFVYAQFADPGDVSSYLLAIRVMETVCLFSQAPFYSKLPQLARLRSEGNLQKQIEIAQDGMMLAYWVYVAGMAAAGFLAQPMLHLIGSETRFVSPQMWALIALAFFIQRHDWMHLQLYSITNHIIWHTVNGYAFVIMMLLMLLILGVFPAVGIAAFPLALLIGHAVFFTWYVSRHSYRAFGLKVRTFEFRTAVAPLLLMILLLGVYLSLPWYKA